MSRNKNIVFFFCCLLFLTSCAGFAPRQTTQSDVQHRKEIDRLNQKIKELHTIEEKNKKQYKQQLRRMEITLQLMEKNLQRQDQIEKTPQIQKKDTIGEIPLQNGELNLVEQGTHSLPKAQQKQAFNSLLSKKGKPTIPAKKAPNTTSKKKVETPKKQNKLATNVPAKEPIETVFLLPSEKQKAHKKQQALAAKQKKVATPTKVASKTQKQPTKQAKATAKPTTTQASLPPLYPNTANTPLPSAVTTNTVPIKKKQPILPVPAFNKKVATVPKFIDPLLEESPAPISLWVMPEAQTSYNQAFKSYSLGKYKKSIILFTKFLKQYPNSQDADNSQFWIGCAQYHLKNYHKAIAAFRAVLQNYKHGKTIDGYKTPDAILMLGKSYLKLNNLAKAKYYFQQTTAYFPNSVSSNKAQITLNNL